MKNMTMKISFIRSALDTMLSDASSHLYDRPCPSVGPSVRNAFVKIGLKWILDPGRGRKRDEEERATRRKEGRGGRSDEEEAGVRRKERRGWKKRRGWKSDEENEKKKKFF